MAALGLTLAGSANLSRRMPGPAANLLGGTGATTFTWLVVKQATALWAIH